MQDLANQWDPAEGIDSFGTNSKENEARGDYFLESANKVHFFAESSALVHGKSNQLKPEFQNNKIEALNKSGHAMHMIQGAFRQYALSNKVSSLVLDLGWEDPVVPQSMYIFKQKRIGGTVTSHQDSTFLFTEPKQSCLGLWLALHDANVENGCLWVRPGSHWEALRRQYTRNPAHFGPHAIDSRSNVADGVQTTPKFIMKELVDSPIHWDGDVPKGGHEALFEAGFVPIECKAGDLLAFNGQLDHLSLPNSSDKPRHTFQLHLVEGDLAGVTWSKSNWLQYPSSVPFMSLLRDKTDLDSIVENENNNGEDFEYVFGFGSIMNSSTHSTWQTDAKSEETDLPGRIVKIKKSFGYGRYWNFRSTTGFTALGVSRVRNHNNNLRNMNGVLFRVPSSMMPGFDRREAGYDKVSIPLEYIQVCDQEYPKSSKRPRSAFELQLSSKIWIYVPKESHCREADENHPLLQSYVDTVLQGCLEWGGEKMAEDFILSTGKWSSFFLNDIPNSRRPWLFRKEYDTIDRVLQRHAELTHYADRRHPEEFASTFLLRRMRGTWSLPRRNHMFTGRDTELGQIHARLTRSYHNGSGSYSDYYEASSSSGSVSYLEVTGLGGVGKSSICAEYCYRHFPSSYGLVVWLNAESAEALVADYRQLLADLADVDINASNKDNVNNNTTEEVIGEVKTRLFRSNVPWLLVFDNLEDRKLLRTFVPRGAASGSKGHVLITTRLFDVELGQGPTSSLVLGCLSSYESFEMLKRALGPEYFNNDNRNKNEMAAREICERLGHLPLALGMAAAYMHRCDVGAAEYIERYVRSEKGGRSLLRHQAGRLHDYNLTVTASLSLSLKAIEKEHLTASDMLRLLCWLGPDQITKAVIRALLNAKTKADEERRLEEEKQQQKSHHRADDPRALPANVGILLLLGLVVLGSTAAVSWSKGNSANRLHLGLGLLATSSLGVSTGIAFSFSSWRQKMEDPMAPEPELKLVRRQSSGGGLPVDEFEQSDLIWNILKSFSILQVKEGKGTMHRLLSQSLRDSQSKHESCYNIEICAEAMPRIWTFDAKNTETWQSSLSVVEHVKALVTHSVEQDVSPDLTLRTGILSKEAAVFIQMALNGFKEAQTFLELALKIFDKCGDQGDQKSKQHAISNAKAEALHELGRVLRYQGNFTDSEEALLSALSIREDLALHYISASHSVADTLHELGVLEVKKHNLDSSQIYLTKALDLRRSLGMQGDEIDADCAATLHQLATVHVARKPPLLDEAEKLLQEALRLSRQIGQRAATLKQLARVTIRQGLLDTAEGYLRKALELYIELYGDRAMHINIAAVKFQQGALALQRDQLKQAWIHFSECLRIRRHVYAYARPMETSDGKASGDPLHLEVSCVLHELGSVAFAQGLFSQALEMLLAERSILEKLEGSSMHVDRLLQSRLTNLTWLRKCAKEIGDEDAAAKYTTDRLQLKSKQKARTKELYVQKKSAMSSLQEAALQCRLSVRQFVLAKCSDSSVISKDDVLSRLARLGEEVEKSSSSSMGKAARQFHDCVLDSMRLCKCEETRSELLQACDCLR
mgnify:CR=1 FL=1